jgi:predicted O-linked N-acetylglucosamine transferase (SPINDLY family)
MKETIEHIAEYLGADTSTILPALTAVFVFALGLIMTLIGKYISYLVGQYQTRKIFRLIATEFVTNTEKQAVEFKNFSISLGEENINNFSIRQQPNPVFLIWSKLIFKDNFNAFFSHTFKLFRNNKRRKAFSEIYNQIQSVENIEKQYFNSVVEVSNKFNKYQSDWNQIAENIKKEFYTVAANPQNNQEYLEFVDGFKDIMIKWQDIAKTRNLKLVDEQIFPKLINHCRNNLKYSSSLRIINWVDDGKYALMNVYELLKTYKELFEFYHEKYTEASVEIRNALKTI